MLDLGLRFEMRTPAWATPAERAQQYRAAVEQAAWADRLGFSVVRISEHHASSDSYCPSPLVLAAAVAAVTSGCRSGSPPCSSPCKTQ